MQFLLSSQNVFEYLKQQHIYTQAASASSQIDRKVARNFNLILELPGDRTIIIKQEGYAPDQKATNGLANEWHLQQFLQSDVQDQALQSLIDYVATAIHFDAENSIIIFEYLKNHCDLIDFYTKNNSFPTEIPTAVGKTIAAFHRSTLNRQDYGNLFTQGREASANGGIPQIIRKFDRITPDIFGQMPADGLRFFALYQRYDSLRAAIIELTDTIAPCCLTHNDLKLNNVLLHEDWQQVAPDSKPIVRIIDWERCAWGDPAFDIGMLIGSYLLLWLKSLVVSKSIAVEESLRLAVTPLEQIQPSIAALVNTYLTDFPEMLLHCPQFLRRSIQFSGLALILQIQSTLQNRKTFGNSEICMLQVAKGLLCKPDQFAPTVLGAAVAEMPNLQMD